MAASTLLCLTKVRCLHQPNVKKWGHIMKYLAKLYRKMVDYLNDSGDLTTGSHRGEPQCCSLYSGLAPMDVGDHRQ